MSKKTGQDRQRTPALRKSSRTIRVDQWLDQAALLMELGAYEGAADAAQHALRMLDGQDPRRAEALGILGVAEMMLEDFAKGFRTFSEAVALAPDDSSLWYNRALSARLTSRFGRSQRDLERAVELEGKGSLASTLTKELRFARKLVRESLKLRGHGFTVEQLIEQEDLFQQGTDAVEGQQWARGEELFRKLITLGDCLPQPWGNLGICLLMQDRLDEAEHAFNRALELDSNYELARLNLEVLAETRRTGKKPLFGGVSEPFRGLSRGIIFDQR